MKGERYADYRRSKEANSPAPPPLLQDMLQVRWQEPDICDKMQEMPQRPDEAKEQDAGCKEVRPLFSLLEYYLIIGIFRA